MMKRANVRHWLEGTPDGIGNFGDYLSTVLLEKFLDSPIVEADVYHLVGSVIDEGIMRHDLQSVGGGPGKIAFWGCGMREDRAVSPWLHDNAFFFGIRGPLSRDRLELPTDTPIGDTGLLLPLILPKDAVTPHGKTLCLLHYFDPCDETVARERTGVEIVRRAAIPATSDGFFDLLACIAGARFVLTGALHGAIAALAYGVPFAYLDLGYIDCLFKWRDFSGSIGIETRFVSTLAEGERVYESAIASHAVTPPLGPLLGVSPFSLRADVVKSLDQCF